MLNFIYIIGKFEGNDENIYLKMVFHYKRKNPHNIGKMWDFQYCGASSVALILIEKPSL